jgi:hypothetical protein
MPRIQFDWRPFVPFLIALAGTRFINYSSIWEGDLELALWLGATIWVAVVSGGRLRNLATVLASLLFCFGAIEIYSVVTRDGPINTYTTRHSISIRELGSGPTPGILHQTKTDAKTGKLIADADYTIDSHGHRSVISASNGPTVAFFGDSMTFGEGLPDNQTLPQYFADLEPETHVVNMAFPGYGPQQFLRALEADLFTDVLTAPRMFVYETALWHAERTSCLRQYTRSAPRYEMINARPTFQGACRGKRSVLTFLQGFIGKMAIYSAFVEPAFVRVGPADIDLYIAVLVRAGQLAREKYGIPTLILYLPDGDYARHTGSSDEEVMERLRRGDLTVVDGYLDPRDFPGRSLTLPGDPHPSGTANLARAKILYNAFHDEKLQTHVSQ